MDMIRDNHSLTATAIIFLRLRPTSPLTSFLVCRYVASNDLFHGRDVDMRFPFLSSRRRLRSLRSDRLVVHLGCLLQLRHRSLPTYDLAPVMVQLEHLSRAVRDVRRRVRSRECSAKAL
jgi:hypothetical protein